MSAEIIDLCAWRRERRAPETTFVSVPLLLPTWPWGWLQPVLVEVDLGIIDGRPHAALWTRRSDKSWQAISSKHLAQLGRQP